MRRTWRTISTACLSASMLMAAAYPAAAGASAAALTGSSETVGAWEDSFVCGDLLNAAKIPGMGYLFGALAIDLSAQLIFPTASTTDFIEDSIRSSLPALLASMTPLDLVDSLGECHYGDEDVDEDTEVPTATGDTATE